MRHERGLRVRVLGAAALVRDGEPVEIASPRQRAILATLVAADGDPVPTGVLIDAVWGDRLPASPEAALQTQLSRVRDLLGHDAEALVRAPGGYALNLDRSRVDAWHFRDLVTDGTDTTADPRTRIGLLREALDLWHGSPLVDADARGPAQPAARALEQLAEQAREDLAEALLAAGEIGAALARLEPLVDADPLRERPVRLLMRALYAAGRQGEALEAAQRHRRALDDELGLTPTPQLDALEHAILNHAIDVPAIPPSSARRSGRLPPPPVTDLVGRRAERADAADRLRRARIVTIIGAGGVGKTRLALHVAHDVAAAYPDGVWWCDLAAVVADRDGTGERLDVATALAAVLDVEERAGGTLTDRLLAVLSTRRCLLVFDNCEHVLESTAELVERIVRSVPGTDALLTSREPLAVDGEHRLRLEPLAVPTGVEITDAVVLFLQRVKAVNADATTDGHSWDAVIEVCRTLDGLPLALEFAAARVAHMTVADVAGQLDHRFELLGSMRRATGDRHGSLATTLEWSYDLLDDEERAVLDALSVFAGGFTLDGAVRLCAGTGLEPAAIRSAVAHLADRSLVCVTERSGSARYHLLETVRAYGLDRLERAGELDAWRERHVAFTIELARRADAALRSRAEPEWHTVLDDHVGDLRSARATLIGNGDVARLVELCASVAWFADPRSRPELDRWAHDTVARVEAGKVSHPRLPQLYAMAGCAALTSGHFDEARELTLTADEIGGRRSGHGMNIRARLELFRGDLDAARRLARESIARFRAAGDEYSALIAMTTDVVALVFGGRSDESIAAADRLLTGANETGSPSLMAMSEYCMAEAVMPDTERARDHLERGIELARSVGTGFFEGVSMTALAALEVRGERRGRDPFAALAGSLEHWERAGMYTQQWWLTLRLLIEALSAAGRHVEVATLAAAFDASATTGPVYGADADRMAAARDRAAAELTVDELATAAVVGAGLGDEAALAYGRRVVDDIVAGAATPNGS